MMYDISEYIDPQKPLYKKGRRAIEKRDNETLDEVIKHPDFDSASYEARALLFCAAENINIVAFHKLGDANVLLFNPLKILKERPHILSKEYNCSNVYLIQDTTPLHTLFHKMHLRCFQILDLKEHFSEDDIEKTLNTYSFKDKGTPLDIAWENHIRAQEFLLKQARARNEAITELPTDFLNFCIYAQCYLTDITAPTLVEKPLLFQRAIQEKDVLTLHVFADYTVSCLNLIGYKFSKTEYDALLPIIEPENAQEMQKGFEEPPVQRTTFLNKTKQFFNKILSRQKD